MEVEFHLQSNLVCPVCRCVASVLFAPQCIFYSDVWCESAMAYQT